jgi:cell division protein FtsQ
MMRFRAQKQGKSRNRKRLRVSLKGLSMKRSLILGALILLIGAGVMASFGLYRAISRAFPVNEVAVYGNMHLSDGELRALAGIYNHDGFLKVSAREVSERVLKSPWIKAVSVRKDFPHRVLIKVQETSPFAILEMKGRAFLIDEKGRMLEEMKDAVPFLPVITTDPSKNRDNFTEALSLARVLKDRKIAAERNRVEIIADKGPENISLVMDNVVIKIGRGNYEQKLNRLFELEEEIKRRAVAVDYVDLRFANRVVVKPISGVVR